MPGSSGRGRVVDDSEVSSERLTARLAEFGVQSVFVLAPPVDDERNRHTFAMDDASSGNGVIGTPELPLSIRDEQTVFRGAL